MRISRWAGKEVRGVGRGSEGLKGVRCREGVKTWKGDTGGLERYKKEMCKTRRSKTKQG